MKKSNWVGVSLSILIVVVFLVWVPAGAQRDTAGTAPVTVTNGAERPVPVTAPGPIPVTGNLSITNGNDRPVPVTAPVPIPVTGSLSVSNASIPVTAADTFPVAGTVNIGGTAHVMVDNEASNPVPVASQPDINSLGTAVIIHLDRLDDSIARYDVDRGKILVIDYVSGFAKTFYEDPDAQMWYHVQLQHGDNQYFWGPTSRISAPQTRKEIISEYTKIIIPGPASVLFYLWGLSGAIDQVAVTFCGRLIDAPQL